MSEKSDVCAVEDPKYIYEGKKTAVSIRKSGKVG
jgi:hypothetical protein